MDKEQNNSQNKKNALAFIPLLAFVLYFIEQDKTERFTRNLRYAMFFFIVFFFSSLLFRYILLGFVVLGYIVLSIWLALKAYGGDDVQIKMLDDLFDKFNK